MMGLCTWVKVQGKKKTNVEKKVEITSSVRAISAISGRNRDGAMDDCNGIVELQDNHIYLWGIEYIIYSSSTSSSLSFSSHSYQQTYPSMAPATSHLPLNISSTPSISLLQMTLHSSSS